MKRFLTVTLFIFMFPFLLHAAEKITIKDFMKFKYPRDLAVSPDGGQFVFTIRSANFEDSRWQTQLWYMPSANAEPRRLTYDEVSDYSPRWSPDGKWVTFLSGREYVNDKNEKKSGTPQLWALPMAGGEARRLTGLENGVEDYRWSDDGKFIVLLSTAEKPEDVQKREERNERLKFDAVVKDSVKENKVFWTLNFSNSKVKRLVELDPGVDRFSLSHDGQWIVYQTNYTGSYNDEQKYDLWLVNISSADKQQLTNFPGPETQPRFSPDDRWIAYINQTTPDVEFAETDLARIRFSPGVAQPDTATLTRDLNLSVTDYKWKPDGKSFVIQVAEGTLTPLYQFNYLAQKKRYAVLNPDGGNALDIHLAGKKNALFYLWEDGTHLPEIASIQKGKQLLLSDFSAQLKPYNFGTQKLYTWKNTDGKQIEGILFFPPDFDPNKKYPLVLTVHGGPYGSGYSDAFSNAIWYKMGGHMGGGEYEDIMAGVDAIVKEGYIDSTRMGVIGGSYGGYMTNWIISQNNRFAAAVSEFGIFSWLTDWSNSWQPAFEKMYFGIYYWEKPIDMGNHYIAYSPAFYVTNIHTPVLILHGTQDRYTNLANSQEMYQALNTLGREVKFVIYPREGHGISREPNHALDEARRSKRWFDDHLKK
ncbi:MAG: S9 family peptidase [Calditrichia bacterium]